MADELEALGGLWALIFHPLSTCVKPMLLVISLCPILHRRPYHPFRLRHEKKVEESRK